MAQTTEAQKAAASKPVPFKPTKKAAAEAKRLYKGGKSVRAVATEIGCSYGSARGLLTSAGVVMRKQGGVRKTAVKAPPKAKAAAAPKAAAKK